MGELKDTYSNPLALTSQFRFCGNPFRLDFYTFCSFGCKYCFARNIRGQEDFDYSYAKFSLVEALFNKAFKNDEPTRNATVELLRHRVPIHVGGLADPFQPIEFKLRLNYKLLELSKKYNYPLIFSTKACELPEDYWELLDPNIHAFQISLFAKDDEFVRKYEDNSPSATQRLAFLKELRNKGFWCSIRIQPLIDLDKTIELCKEINGIASYVTIEHLKINTDNPVIKELFKDEIPKYKRTSIMRNLELDRETKQKNIETLKQYLDKTMVGVGDNDLHYLSQSRCCCGVDTINSNFDNWLKYNLTYFTTEHLAKEQEDYDSLWVPKCNISSSLNGDCVIKGVGDYKAYVDTYCGKYNEFMCDGCSMKQKLDGISYSKKTGRKTKQFSIFNFDDQDI